MPSDTPTPVLDETEQPPRLASTPPGAQDEDFSILDLLDFLFLVKRRGRLILQTTLASVALATLLAFILPVRYTAKVTLMPPQQNTSVGAAISSQLSNLGGMGSLASGSLNLKNQNDMYVAMLKGSTVENAMVEHFELMKQYRKKYLSDARKAFERRTSVDGAGKDGLIHLSVEDPDPRRAAELANGYVEQFRALTEHLAITEAAQRRLFFEKQLLQAKDNLANAEEALKRTEQATGLIQLDSQARALVESAASLRAQIAVREVQIQGMQTYATDQNSQLVQAQRELQGLRAQLAKLSGQGDEGEIGIVVPKGKVPEAGIAYIRSVRDVKYNETVFEILARQFEIAKLDEAKQGAVIQVVDAAIPPDKRSSPQRLLIILGGALVGLFGGIIAAYSKDWFARVKNDPVIADKFDRLWGA